MDQFPDEQVPLEQTSHINESRRRRTRRLIVPTGKTERSLYVNEIAKRLVPELDFYLFSALCGLVLGTAILLDHPAIYVLAALVAPFMAPLVGLGFSTAVGSVKFFTQSLGSLAIGSVFLFIGGALSGWISRLIPMFDPSQIEFHTKFSTAGALLLSVGTILAIFLTVRVPKQRSLIASVALAYEVYLPIGVAGFALTSGMKHYCLPALELAGINILLVIVIGSIVSTLLKLRPFTFFGYLLTALLLGGALFALILSGAIKASVEEQIPTTALSPLVQETTALPDQPSETPQLVTPTTNLVTAVATSTNTLVPTRTPTITITPKPAEVWAFINVDVGVYIRLNPCVDDTNCPKVGAAVANKTPVLVLAFTEDQNWVQVRLDDGREGWVNRAYLLFD